MKYFPRKISYAVVAALLLVISILLSLPSCGSSEATSRGDAISSTSVPQTDGVSSVTLNSRGNKLTVRSVLSSDFIAKNPHSTIYLFELGAGDNSSSLASLTPVYSFRASSKSSWSATLYEGSLSRLFCFYVLASKNEAGEYAAIGSAVPVLNPEVLAARTYAYPAAVSIKGIETESVADALSLGASHVVLNIKIEDYIAIPDPSVPETLQTVEYIYNGITYHFSAAALLALDGKIKTLSDESITVYLRFILGTQPSELPDKLKCLGYSGSPAAGCYAINIFNSGCSGYIAALFSLFSERYTRPDGECGFCGSFIIGSDVNNSSVSNSAGADTDAASYAAAYERLVRIARTALVSNYKYGRVYISLGSNWNAALSGSKCAADSSASNFLSSFSAIASASGDYNWGVASSAYALDPADSSIWDDPLATGASSQYLSPANISVLTYALSKNYTFLGSMRSTVICSFGVHGDKADASSLAQQASSYAYAYYKAAADGAVGALIYSTLDDASGDTHQYGLRSSGNGGAKGLRKPVWDIFASIDTKNDGAVGAASALAGSEFAYLYNSLSSSVKLKNSLTGVSAAVTNAGIYRRLSVFDFTKGELSGFSLVSSAGILDLSPVSGKPALRILNIGDAGISCSGVGSHTAKDSDYLLVDIANADSGGQVTLRLSQNAKNGYIAYESTAAYNAGKQIISFDISDFSKSIASGSFNISLWFSPSSAEKPYEISISGIEAADAEAAASPVLWIIVISVIIFFLLLMLIAVFSRMIHRFKRRRAGIKRDGSGRPSSGGALTTLDED